MGEHWTPPPGTLYRAKHAQLSLWRKIVCVIMYALGTVTGIVWLFCAVWFGLADFEYLFVGGMASVAWFVLGWYVVREE